MYKLYWIKYLNHDDPKSQGYIGITSQEIQERFNDHKYNTKNKLLKNRCKKENVEILCLYDNLNKEDACLLEEQYRPHENIGWNINKGGNLPPSRKGKISPKSLLIGKNRTENQKKGSKKRSEKIKGNNFSGQRKIKVDYSKPCENCGVVFNPNYNKKKKYCSILCATQKRNKNPDYIKKLSEKTKEQWEKKKNNGQ